MPVILYVKMKRILFLSLLLAAISFAGFSAVFAADKASDCNEYCSFLNKKDAEGSDLSKLQPDNKTCICNPLTTTKFTDVVDRILNILFFVAIAVAPVMIIVAGFRFLTGGGNPETLKGARQMLIWTAVGFGIILLSKGIVFIVRNVIGF
jgi:hypothetical protein